MDDPNIDVKGLKGETLLLVLRLALAEIVGLDRRAYVGFRVTEGDEEGPLDKEDGPWLVLYRHLPAPLGESKRSCAELFLVPATPEEVAPLVMRWITGEDPKEEYPDIDGSVTGGAFVAFRDWGYVSTQGRGSVLAIRRAWATHHK